MLYHVAIIDFLQDYNLRKQLERLGKGLVVPNINELSVAPPAYYGDRF
jgi:hypothetical protein